MSRLTLAILLATSAGLLAAEPPKPMVAQPALPPGAVQIGPTEFRLTSGRHRKVFFTSDGKTIVSPQSGNVIELWDPETGRRTSEIAIPKSRFEDSDYHTKGNLLAIFGMLVPDDKTQLWKPTVWLINAATRKVLLALPVADLKHSSHNSIRFTPDGTRLILGMDDQIRVWNVKNGDELLRQKHKRVGDVLAISPDGKTIAFGSSDVYLWAWDTGEEPKKFTAMGGEEAERAAFTADGKTLLVAEWRGKVRKFDIASGGEGLAFKLDGYVWNWSFSPDGKTLAAGSRDVDKSGRVVVLCDPATGQLNDRLPIGQIDARHFAWSPDGTRLAAITSYRLFVWDMKSKKRVGRTEPGHDAPVTAFAFGTDGQLFTSSDDHTIRFWDAKTGKPGLELLHDGQVRDVAVSPDGKLVAGSAYSNDLRIWDAKSGEERFKLNGNGGMNGRRKIKFSADGKRLIAWGDDLDLRVWDSGNGKLLAEHRTVPEGVTGKQLADEKERMMIMVIAAADISDDGSTFAFNVGRTVQVFDVTTGKERAKFEAEPNGTIALALSSDGKRLAIGALAKWVESRTTDGGTSTSIEPDHRTAVWDIAEKKCLWHTTTPGQFGRTIQFSPDGRRVAELSTENAPSVIRVWDAATGKDLGRIELPTLGWLFAFDRTGKKIAVAYQDTTATVYDLESVLKPAPSK